MRSEFAIFEKNLRTLSHVNFTIARAYLSREKNFEELGKEYDFFNPDMDRRTIVAEPHEKKWIRCKEAVNRYSLSRPTVCKIACDCNALYKIEGTILIDAKLMDDYIQSFLIPGRVL